MGVTDQNAREGLTSRPGVTLLDFGRTLLLGYPFTPILVTKLAFVATIWVVGPIIDNVVGPSFERLAPGPGESPTPEFKRIQRRYLMLKAAATALFYVVIGLWVLH